MYQHLGRNGGRLLRSLAGKSLQVRGSERLAPRLIPAPTPPCSRIPPNLLRSFSGIIPKQQQHQPLEQPAKSLDDFQHEEITGPTVERDESATGDEVRQSIEEMLRYKRKLQWTLLGFALLQMVIGGIVARSGTRDMHVWYASISGFTSLHLAYLLHHTMKPLPFFQRVEARGRMQTLTLSMQSIKAVINLLARYNVAVRCCVVALPGAFVYFHILQ